MNPKIKSILFVIISSLLVFLLAYVYYNYKLPADMGLPSSFNLGGGGALPALIMAKSLDLTLIYFIGALIVGLWWANQQGKRRK